MSADNDFYAKVFDTLREEYDDGWKEGFAFGLVVALVIWLLLGALVYVVWLLIR